MSDVSSCVPKHTPSQNKSTSQYIPRLNFFSRPWPPHLTICKNAEKLSCGLDSPDQFEVRSYSSDTPDPSQNVYKMYTRHFVLRLRAQLYVSFFHGKLRLSACACVCTGTRALLHFVNALCALCWHTKRQNARIVRANIVVVCNFLSQPRYIRVAVSVE